MPDSFSDTTLFVFGLVLLFASILATAREALREKPTRAVIATGFGMALLGVLLTQSGRIAKITTAGGTIELVNQAKGDVAEIKAVKARVENQSATIDLVARKAGEAQGMAEEAQKKLHSADTRLEDLDKTIGEAKKSLDELNKKTLISRLLGDVESDDRNAYDELIKMVDSGTADTKVRDILHEIVLSRATELQLQYKVPWKSGIEPQKFTYGDLLSEYNTALSHVDSISKYPPAKPGALGSEPLKAVGRVADAAR